MSSRSATGYHLSPTGPALLTAQAHSPSSSSSSSPAPASIELFGACFCPFVQRVWIALELINGTGAEEGGLRDEEERKKAGAGVDYVYVEVDPYKKPKELVEISPKGLVPAIKLGQGKSLHDSLIILHYLSSLPLPSSCSNPLLPSDPYLRAKHLQLGQRFSESIVPGFYRYLQAQEEEEQVKLGKEFVQHLEEFESEMHGTGPFFHGERLGWVDIIIAPWAIRISPVLTHYRGFNPPILTTPAPNGRFSKWLKAVEDHPAVRATTSTRELYVDSYHRYSKNLPMTSQVADAINQGKSLP